MTFRSSLQTVATALALLVTTGCVNDQITASRSSSILVVERIGGARGGTGEDPQPTFLQSDVLTGGRVFDDIGRVTTRLALKDPGSAENPTSPTSANYITVDRYRVAYVRTDGRNAAGVDVPFAFDSAVTFTTVSGDQTAEFVLVRASAKLEAPLRALVHGGGAVIINTMAQVTFYGRDGTGAEVSASGTIGIDFSDWPEAGATSQVWAEPIP